MKRIVYTLMYGSANKELRLDYIYTLDDDPESKFNTVKHKAESITTYIRPSHAISISEGFEKPRLFIPGSHIIQIFDMLSKTVKATSEKLKQLFPNIGRTEFDIDQTALQDFTVNDAVSINGYTALPCVYVNLENECKPAIRLTSVKGDYVRLPLTDAIVMTKLFEHFSPDLFDLQLFNIITNKSGII